MLPDGVLARIIDTARATSGLVALYVFGSQATGLADGGSDIDIGVLGDRPLTLAELVDLQIRIQTAVAARVDLVDLRSAEAFLALDVIRGERVYSRDDLAADTFELFVMRRAGDLEPFERERRRSLTTGAVVAAPPRT
jgi:predicted nucleotidyltransferase